MGIEASAPAAKRFRSRVLVCSVCSAGSLSLTCKFARPLPGREIGLQGADGLPTTDHRPRPKRSNCNGYHMDEGNAVGRNFPRRCRKACSKYGRCFGKRENQGLVKSRKTG